MLDEREEKGLAAKIAAVEEVPTIPAMFVWELCFCEFEQLEWVCVGCF